MFLHLPALFLGLENCLPKFCKNLILKQFSAFSLQFRQNIDWRCQFFWFCMPKERYPCQAFGPREKQHTRLASLLLIPKFFSVFWRFYILPKAHLSQILKCICKRFVQSVQIPKTFSADLSPIFYSVSDRYFFVNGLEIFVREPFNSTLKVLCPNPCSYFFYKVCI